MIIQSENADPVGLKLTSLTVPLLDSNCVIKPFLNIFAHVGAGSLHDSTPNFEKV